ncbi:MAG: hypothetical protein ACRDRM_04890 [Pseudonocardiaceae bacterium]
MASEPEPTSSTLFGADGTQLPDPLPVLPDPLTGPERSPWLDAPEIAPVPLPPLPDGRAMREAIAAVFEEDPAAPRSTASTHPQAGAFPQTAFPQAGALPQAGAFPQAGVFPQTGAFPQAGAFPQTGAPQQRPLLRPVGQPAVRGPAPHPPATHGSATAPHRPQVSTPAGALKPVTAADLRRRPGRDFPAGGLQTRSAGGQRTGCVIALIIFGIITFNIVAGLAQSVSAMFH